MHTYDNTLPLKSFDTSAGTETRSTDSEKQTVSAWTRFVTWFWRHTEQTGKADTKSFDGLL